MYFCWWWCGPINGDGSSVFWMGVWVAGTLSCRDCICIVSGFLDDSVRDLGCGASSCSTIYSVPCSKGDFSKFLRECISSRGFWAGKKSWPCTRPDSPIGSRNKWAPTGSINNSNDVLISKCFACSGLPSKDAKLQVSVPGSKCLHFQQSLELFSGSCVAAILTRLVHFPHLFW